MAALLSLDDTRRNRELANADLAALGERSWRRAWLGAYLQCLGLVLAGYFLFGLSWAYHGDAATLISSVAFLVAYALPFFRLVAFFLRHADQF